MYVCVYIYTHTHSSASPWACRRQPAESAHVSRYHAAQFSSPIGCSNLVYYLLRTRATAQLSWVKPGKVVQNRVLVGTKTPPHVINVI